MTRFVVTCPTCGNISDRVYRCDDPQCGADLASADSQVWEFAWPSVAGVRDDGLAAVEIPVVCVDCDTRRWLPLAYGDIGRVIRLGCPHCSQITRHRPTGQDVLRPVMGLLKEPVETRASFDDHHAASPIP